MAAPIERYSRRAQEAGLTVQEFEILNSIGYLVWNMDVSDEVDDKSLDLLALFQTTDFYKSAPPVERQCGYLEAAEKFVRHENWALVGASRSAAAPAGLTSHSYPSATRRHPTALSVVAFHLAIQAA